MAYNPVSGFTLQVIAQSGEVASDYYLKFYEANTTTPLSMATNSTGGTLLVKAKLSDSGFPISNPLDNSTVFIPHMNANYRLVVYLNETDADANDTASAYVNIPNVSTMVGASAIGTAAYLDTGTAPGEVPTNADLTTVLAPYLGRNLIINGDFQRDCWQRGTSHSTDGYGSADRWNLQLSGATGSFSQQTHTLGQTDVPGNPEYFARLDITGANADAGVQTRIEHVATAAGQEVTLSFYAKSAGTVPTGFKAQLTQSFGTGGSPSSDVSVISSAFTLTSSWQRFTYTVTLASISGKTLGTTINNYLAVEFINDVSELFEFDISNVQLELGDAATDFEYVNTADQLARCQRYYCALEIISVGTSPDTTSVNARVTPHVTMRATPSVSQTGVLKISDDFAADFTQSSTSILESAAVTKDGARIRFGNFTGLTATRFYGGMPNSGSTVNLDAEL